MTPSRYLNRLSSRSLRWLFYLVGVGTFLVLTWWLRQLSFSSSPLVSAYLEIIGALLSFTFAAGALVRFRGTRDRAALVLAFGFLLCGLIETGATFGLYGLLTSSASAPARIPLSWMVGRALLGALLVASLVADRRLSDQNEPNRKIFAAGLVVGVAAYVTLLLSLGAEAEPSIRPTAVVARLWDLFPAGLFAFAAIGFWLHLKANTSALDRALCWAAWMNVACHLAASQSERLLDGPFTLAQALKVSSYALVLGGTLLDGARMFEQVRRQAVSDPLTGLANYRRLLQTLEGELQRSRRTGRPFAVLLFDLDGLKTVNDRYGHLVGSRALCRLARVLQAHSRVMDTAARYGGDEFAVVLPEANGEAAAHVARRICHRLTTDGETPTISVSAGAAVFPGDGETVEKLLGAADGALYRMKASGAMALDFPRIAACL